ncbi:centrosomal protein of 135 kDa-like isoform X1 [Physella acuta]|uniref:centrosomal protein of 135 kDa-like isoform X1 n=2 Tax=Physella acuta TaxID=109671 RepID=UPI0027DCDDF4|nr:centrosomal protein of 135 kDa-like isoform X1 [Physella acuta]XP_059152474.1 centrosomal protein of 135 kDa-like isoform X1 [Physella acuta]
MATTTTVTSQAQQKFSNLRRRLDQLGYKQSLGIESLPLVEKLFVDLVHTTESLKNAKLELAKKTEVHLDVDSAVEPYKSDNAKLIRENNEIHMTIIKQKEESDAKIRELKASLRDLEHKNADLQFLNNQYVHKVRQLEKESKEKSETILKLQEKNFHAVVQTPGGRKKNIPFRRQRMEIDQTVPENDGYGFKVPPPDDPYVADLLQVADARIAELEAAVSEAADLKEVMDRKLQGFREQLSNRDEEIDRLTRMLDGGRPSDVVALDAKNRANERMISHLNIQVDYLQNKNREYERKLREANYQLDSALTDRERVAKKLQVDKEIVVQAADREMNEAKDELEKSRHELEDMDLTVAQLKAEQSRLIKELSDTRARVSTREADNVRLEGLLDRITEEKKRLVQRVNKLTANEKELVLEVERLKKKNGPTVKKNKIPTKLDMFIRSIEQDRDYYRAQAEDLEALLKGEMPKGHVSLRTRSASSSRAQSPARKEAPAKSNKKDLAQYEAIIRVMEEEKDYYKKEYETLKATRRSASPIKIIPKKSVAEEFEMARLTRERDELKSLLDKFERHMAEIQANVKVLTCERDKLSTMYEESKDELMKVRRELISSPKQTKTSLAAQAILRRIENEREDAISDLRRMTTERDSLRERLKIATETSLSDRAKLEQQVEDLESTLHTVEQERNELMIRMNSLKDEIKMMEEQIKDQVMRLNEVVDDSTKNKTSATQMRMLVEETEKTLEDTTRRLSRREEELQNQAERVNNLEEKVLDLQRVVQVQKEEIDVLRSNLKSMDREKDSLQTVVDEKTEKIAHFNGQLHDRERYIGDLKLRIGEIEAQLEHANETLNLKDRELKSMRRQLDSLSEDLTETSRTKDVTGRENRRLQDDLNVMTKENQKLNQELEDAIEEKDALKTQVQQYILEVRRIEDTLSAKEQERGDLLEQYRKLSAEAEQYQTASHQLESEGSNLRLELMTKDSEIRRLRDKVDTLEREIQEHLQSHQAYEIQVSNLTRSVAHLEENLRVTEEDKQELLADLSAARELCSRLETSKENMNRQLTASELDKEQLQNIISDLRQESECLRSQIDQERGQVKNLESVLQDNREKDFQCQLTTQEKNTEIQMLKDRLSLNESKLQGQSREVASLRTKNVELEGDVERMRRQLATERFERDRMAQEMRRNGIQPPVMLSDYSGTRTLSPARSRSPGRSYSPSARPRSRSRSRSPGVRFRTSPNTSLINTSRRSYLYDDDYLTTTSPKTTYNQDLL